MVNVTPSFTVTSELIFTVSVFQVVELLMVPLTLITA